MLRRRVCTPCKKAKLGNSPSSPSCHPLIWVFRLVLESKVPGRFPHLEAGTLDLIPYSMLAADHFAEQSFILL